jgi:hypothetical protein
MKRIFPILYLSLFILSCQSSKGPETESKDKPQPEGDAPFRIEWEKIADEIVSRASLQSGEKVIMVANPGEFDSLVLFLEQKIKGKQADYLGTFSVTDERPENWETDFTREISEYSKERLKPQFQSVDLGIMLPGTDTTHAPYAAMQNVLRNGKGRTIHFHWAGAYSLKGILLSDMNVDQLYQSALLDTDYKKLAQQQSEFEQAARNNKISVTTPLGTDIRFSIGDRPVTKQDGDASKKRSEAARNFIDREVELPAGAVRVAPLEESVEGKIAFPDMQWNGASIRGLVLKFAQGKVVEIKAKEGQEVVKAELKAAGASAAFRELAVGFNPLLAVPEIGHQWIPYYGYGAGVVRLSLGDNTELGGRVGGGYIRWNFFVDATLKTGDQVWIADGKLVDSSSD